ncbi:MAG: DNA repair protein RecO [Candidatus Blackburnbacteria bacterium]|nr:DNA repair protein RecO [Candidatus Blackburnbacteria bacterium]
MEQRTYFTEGVILARKNFGEADRLLVIFSKHYGKIRAIAKGVRKPASRKRGSLEIFNYARILLARGKNLDIVTDVEVKEGFESWRKDLVKVGIAYHLCEIVDRLTVEHQEHKAILDLILDCFSALDRLDYWQLYALTQNFKLEVLEELGFLSKHKPSPREVDDLIEDLIGSKLKTSKFLKTLA